MGTRWGRILAQGVAPVTLMVVLAAPGAWVQWFTDRTRGPDRATVAAADLPVAEPEPSARFASIHRAAPEPALPPRLEPPPPDRFRCRQPDMPVERTMACDLGYGYPACRWRLPDPEDAGYLYGIWRNTVDEHRMGRPGLVSLVLATAAEYARLYPGEVLVIGDLDAPGDRHETHDRGQDVDLYLPGVMATENLPNGEQPDNYRGRSSFERRMLRARVETLARILAVCSEGRVRIYYNDPTVERRFLDWYGQRGWQPPLGAAMQPHNDLHRFHFHVTVPEDLPTLPPVGGSS